MDIVYQVREVYTGRLVVSKESKRDTIGFLLSRNPKQYEVFLVHPLSREVRSISSGERFVSDRSTTEKREEPLELKFEPDSDE